MQSEFSADCLLENSQLEPLCVNEDSLLFSVSSPLTAIPGGRSLKAGLRACRRMLMYHVKKVCLCVFFVVGGIVTVFSFRRSHQASRCLQCPFKYLSATACLLGGQKLSQTEWQKYQWDRLHQLLQVGSPYRTKLEELFASSEFKDAARCPLWARWNSSKRACEAYNASSCPVSGSGSWHTNGDEHSSCTTNLFIRPQVIAEKITNEKTHVWAVPCSDSPSQHGWVYAHDQLVSPEGLCVTFEAASRGAMLYLSPCAGLQTQRFFFDSRQFKIFSGDLCVNICGVHGPRLILYECEPLSIGRRLASNDEWLANGDTIQTMPILGEAKCLASKATAPYDSIWGGLCTCPDGAQYIVSDDQSRCKALACFGGVPGSCSPKNFPEENYGAKVICGIDFVRAMDLASADPERDPECWAGKRPLFVQPRFPETCPDFAPQFMNTPDMNDIFHGVFELLPKNYHPDAADFPDFIDFYDQFYGTAAGPVCRAAFGVERLGGPALVL